MTFNIKTTKLYTNVNSFLVPAKFSRISENTAVGDFPDRRVVHALISSIYKNAFEKLTKSLHGYCPT